MGIIYFNILTNIIKMESSADINKTFSDFMNCGKNQAILGQLDTAKGEAVVFSCIVEKINRFGMK